jgi:branched-chain amino acid transport system substrate-binding protein
VVGEPGRYFRTERRSVMRITPPDDVQGAAGALLARDQGARRAYVLNHGQPYGFGVAEAFRVAATRSGLEVVGTKEWDPRAPSYRELAQRIRTAGADAVYFGGYTADNGRG